MAVRKTAAGLRLKRWFKEDWRTPRGKKDYRGGENTFRPTKRISKDTPSTWSELSRGERRRAQIEKNTKGRVSRYKKMENGGIPRRPRPYAPNPRENTEVGKGLSAEKMRSLRKMTDDSFNEKAKNFEYTPQTKQRRFVEELKPQTVIDKKNRKMEKGGMSTPAWTRKEGKSPSGGLNRKGIASYRRANPGSKLKMAVTTKPSKLKRGSKAAKRRGAFCARMEGMKKTRTSAKTARDPNSRINKSLRKWNCEHGCAVMVKRKSKK